MMNEKDTRPKWIPLFEILNQLDVFSEQGLLPLAPGEHVKTDLPKKADAAS